MGFDPVSQIEDSIQYAPIESTLRAILSHQDVLPHILQQQEKIVCMSHLGMVQHIKIIYF